MNEIRLWKWEYTDAAGRRQVSRWLMTEREALRYKDAIRLHHTYEVVYEGGPWQVQTRRRPGTTARED